MNKLQRAFYHDSIEKFLLTSHSVILGILAQNNHFELSQEQRNAWTVEIQILQNALIQFSGNILLEYAIPRMGKRADVILLINQSIFVLEFKVGAHNFERYALDQVTDYALDLKNFHADSYNRPIVPVLLATAAQEPSELSIFKNKDDVCSPLLATKHNLQELIACCSDEQKGGDTSWQSNWPNAGYHPTPTIIEAAQALYAGHSVSEISRSDAGAINLSQTAKAVTDIITQAKIRKQKTICFITGVPGAGKTLAGLNIANCWQDPDNGSHAVFLSGNGPLVYILREALSRDEKRRVEMAGKKSVKRNVNDEQQLSFRIYIISEMKCCARKKHQ